MLAQIREGDVVVVWKLDRLGRSLADLAHLVNEIQGKFTACSGRQPYSQEEMVAEMGASFLCSNAQVDFDNVIENNAAYLAGWLKILKEDSKFIFKAAAEAQKAADYVLNRRLVVEASSN